MKNNELGKVLFNFRNDVGSSSNPQVAGGSGSAGGCGGSGGGNGGCGGAGGTGGGGTGGCRSM